MIEKVGLRAAEFVGSTARRVAGAAEEVINDHRKPKHRLAKVVVPAVAAGAAAVAAAASGAANRSSSSTSTKRSGSGSATKSRPTASTSSSNGKAKSVAEKTRDELYELAKKADIPGRSGMTKDVLAKALGK